jgi:hypothetical protein
MPWFKVDDGFHGHPKVVELSLSSVGLWTLAGSWCAKYLTDGFVADKTVKRLGASSDETAELVNAGLWLTALGGFEFKDWADYQPLKADVEAERAAAQERMRKVRAKKKGVIGSGEQTPNVQENFARSSEDVRVTPSQSHPSPIPVPPTGEARKRGTRLNDLFEVTPAMVTWAAENAPDVNGKRATEMFMNYYKSKSGQAGVRVDWVLTWKNWLLKDQQTAEERRTKPTPEQRARQTLALATDFLDTPKGIAS